MSIVVLWWAIVGLSFLFILVSVIADYRKVSRGVRLRGIEYASYSLFALILSGSLVGGILCFFPLQQEATFNGKVISGNDYFPKSATKDNHFHIITIGSTYIDSRGEALFYYLTQKLHKDIRISSRSETTGEYTSKEEERKLSVQAKKESVGAMYLSAYEYVGKPIPFTSHYEVVTAFEKFPRTKQLLRDGDKIISFDDIPMEGIQKLHTYILEKKPQQIRFELERAGLKNQYVVELDRTFGDGYFSLGFAIGTDLNYTLPEDAPVVNSEAWSGGNSAGMMMAIQVASILSGVDYSKGLQVAGTGAINVRGNVNAIGGLYNKISTVKTNGNIDIMLIPKSMEEEGQGYIQELSPHFDVHAVSTLKEAIDYLSERQVATDYSPSLLR